MAQSMVVSIFKKDEVAIFDTAGTTPVSGYHQQPIDNILIQNVFQEIHQIASCFTCPVDLPLGQALPPPFQISSNNLSEFRRLGRIIHTQCIPQNIRMMLEQSPPSELILRMDAGLMNIPWEIAFDGKDYLSMRFCLSRQILISNPPPGLSHNISKPVSYPVKILIIADPSGTLPMVDQEVETLMDLLDNIPRFQVDVIGGSRATRLHILKLIESYDIVHFAGHSAVDPTRPDQTGWRLSDGFLNASDFQGLNTPPMLIFSNSCASAATGKCMGPELPSIGDLGLGGGFLLAGVRHFIGALWVIHDASSAAFASHVYQELLNGKSIGSACLTARQECMRQYPELVPVWSAYVHYGNPSDILMPVPEWRLPDLPPEISIPVSRRSGLRWGTGALLALFLISGICLGFWLWPGFRQAPSNDKVVTQQPVIDPLAAPYEKAFQDYQHQRVDEAITELVSLTDRPENVTGTGLALLSEIYREAGLNQQADICLEKALSKNPSDSLALVLKGEHLWEAGNASGADGCFAQAAESSAGNPSDRARAWNSRGALAFLAGNNSSAKLFFDTALQIHPPDTDAQFNLAFLSCCQNDHSTAARYLEPLLKRIPRDAMAGELQSLLNRPSSSTDTQNSSDPVDILVIPPILSHGRLNRIGMDRILNEKIIASLKQHFPDKVVKAGIPVYGQDYARWKQRFDNNQLASNDFSNGGAPEIICGEFGQTVHTITMTIKWIQTDSGQIFFSRTVFGNGPEKMDTLLDGVKEAIRTF